MPTTAEAPTMAEPTPSLEADKHILREMVEEVTTIVSQCRGTGLIAEDYTELAKSAKARFLEDHPERRQEIELVFGLPEFFGREDELRALNARKDRRAPAGYRDILVDLTEYTFTITNFLTSNSANPKYLREFWRSLDKVARASRKSTDFGRHKAGWLGAAAAYHLMAKFNMHPVLATPKQDAFKGIDVCGRVPGQEVPVAFQTKAKGKFVEANLEGKRFDVYPIAETDSGKPRVYESPHPDQYLAARVVDINLPHDSFDWVAGLPTESGVEQFGNQLEDLKRYLETEGL